MNPSPSDRPYETEPSTADVPIDQRATVYRSLRIWPVILLLLGMWLLPKFPKLFESPSIAIFMVSMMGPALLGIFVMIWWLFASRASLVEKLFGIGFFVLIMGVGISLLHKSMKEMGVVISVIPGTAAAFAAPLVLLANQPIARVVAALFFSLVSMVYFDLIQSKGVDGQFVADIDWRWNKTAEEVYLESLSRNNASKEQVQDDLPPITLANSEWPSFRGPNRDGSQDGVQLPEDWNAHPPRILWNIKIGPAWSSFTVAGKFLFTQEQRGEQEAVLCLDADTGKIVWAYEYKSRFEESVAGAGPRATPTIADEGLFALGADGVLVCLDAKTGKLQWQADLQKEANRKPPQWGFSASPLVTQGVVVVHAGGSGTKGVIAYEAKTGKLSWEVASGDHSYSSPHLAQFHGVEGILMETNSGLQFIDPKNGTVIWQYEWSIQNYRALQPIAVGNKVLLASSLGEGTRCLEITKEETEWKVSELWSSKELKPDFNDFVEHNGFLYGYDGSIFTCVDLSTGKRRWKKGRYGSGQVLLLPESDQLLVVSEQGELVLLKADPQMHLELAKLAVIDGKTWNHPVVVGNRVYIRNGEHAACLEFDVKSEN